MIFQLLELLFPRIRNLLQTPMVPLVMVWLLVAKNPNTNSKFKNGTRYEKCRICKVLESEGDTDIYEDHYSSLVIGCPRLASMGTVERRKYVDLAQICRFCLDPLYIHRKGSKHVNFPVFQ